MVFDFYGAEFAEKEPTRGFLPRDIIRFIAVDIVFILLVGLGVRLDLFATTDIYVGAILTSKLLLLCYLLWLIRDRREAWPETGVMTFGRWWGWLISLVLYGGYYHLFPVINDINLSFLTTLYRQFGFVYVYVPQDVMIFVFSDILNQPMRWVLVFFTIIAGPFMEELAFRGMGYDAYSRTRGLAWTLIWTSLLFGLYHFRNDLVFPLALLGLLFGMSRALSGSLWCPILIHCVHNALALLSVAQELGFVRTINWGHFF